MKKFIQSFVIVMLSLVISCQSIDVTEVTNPNLTVDNFLGTGAPMTAWVIGIRRQFSQAVNEYLPAVEIATDNYVNTQTFFNQNLDNLGIIFTDDDINDFAREVARVRELAIFGLTEIAAADPTTTPQQLAELTFFQGMFHLIAGEYFVATAFTPEGELFPPADHFNEAISLFNASIALGPDATIESATLLGLARANYGLGNVAAAVAAANAALANATDFVYFTEYDNVNGPTNTLQNALYDRGGFDDLQPLPRLDFLDPKFSLLTGNIESNIPILKSEEAYLILAEAALANSDLTEAQNQLGELIALVDTRPILNVDEGAEDRTENNPGTRPRSSSVMVRASASDPLRAGLVLDRNNGPGTIFVDVPVVSGTSITMADVNALSTIDEAVEMIYLMRQEIFIAEGRRFIDMGLRFPISEIEALANPNTTVDDLETQGIIPPFLQSISSEVDAFDFNTQNGEVTITHNINAIISQNRTSSEVAPFF